MIGEKEKKIIGEEKAERLAESAEISRYYHVLAVKRSNSIMRVFRKGGSTEQIIDRARKETKLLLETEEVIELAPGNRNHQCPQGTIWDEELGRCVPI